MAKPKGGPGEAPNNTEAFIAVMLLFVALVCYVIWRYARAVIVMPALALDYVFILIVQYTKGIGPAGMQYKNYIAAFFNGTYQASVDMQWGVFVGIRSVVGAQVNIFLAGIIGIFATIIFLKMKGKGYARKFSLADNLNKKKNDKPSFGRYQAEAWKVATYSSQFDPDGADKDVRPSATPPEWLQQKGIAWENGRFDDANKQKLYETFSAQLGTPWHGFARSTTMTKAILILAALHYLGSMEKYLKYGSVAITEREDLNIAWAGKNNGTQATEALVAKWKDTPEIITIVDHFCKENGFEHTAIFNFLAIARKKSGILKDADMGYVKRFDRALWYTLNNCGRHAYHIEAAGVVNHYKAERVNRAPLREARVNEAIVGLETYLNSQAIYSLTNFFDHEDIV